MLVRKSLGGRGIAVASAALVGALAWSACSTSPAERVTESVGTEQEALVDGGVATTAATPDLSAVAFIKTASVGNCSGTLIGPRTVLTAAHCFFTVAQGCQVKAGVQTVTFADPSGSRTGPGAQTINSLGISAHPDAYGFDASSGNPSRVASCADPVPPPAACPDPTVTPAAFNNPSCALLRACFPGGVNALPACVPNMPCPASIVSNTIGGLWGFKSEHDFALIYLESEPVGIAPMPVLTRGWSAPSQNVFETTSAAFDS